MVDIIAIAKGLGLSISTLKGIWKHFSGSKDNPIVINNYGTGDLHISVGNGPAIDNIDKLFPTQNFGLISEDVIDVALNMIDEAINKEDDLAVLKDVLEHDDFKAIVISFSAIRMANNGNDKGEAKQIKELQRIYGLKGKKIYNLVRGGYLEDLIDDLKWDRIALSAEPIAIKERFQTRFNKIVDYCTEAVFINAYKTPIDVACEILEKLNKDAPKVHVHYREPRRKIIDNAVEIIKLHENSDINRITLKEVKDGTILEREAYILIISRVNIDIKRIEDFSYTENIRLSA